MDLMRPVLLVTRLLLVLGTLMLAACSTPGQRGTPQQEPAPHDSLDGTALALFKPNSNWQLVEDVSAEGAKLITTRGENYIIALNDGGELRAAIWRPTLRWGMVSCVWSFYCRKAPAPACTCYHVTRSAWPIATARPTSNPPIWGDWPIAGTRTGSRRHSTVSRRL